MRIHGSFNDCVGPDHAVQRLTELLERRQIPMAEFGRREMSTGWSVFSDDPDGATWTRLELTAQWWLASRGD